MSDHVRVMIRRPVYEKLQRLAVLTGDESTAIERLIAHWEKAESDLPLTLQQSEKTPARKLWRSPNGDLLPIGETLQCTDGGKAYQATVERDGIHFRGKVYASPSAAARAVKQLRGLRGPSASTNGRDFWKIRDPSTSRWIPIGLLRPTHQVDVDTLLRDLEEHRPSGSA